MTSRMSRSGQTSPLGKLTAELKTRVAEDTRDELERQAREAGMVLGEYIREVLMIRAHGIEMVRSLYDARLSLVAGIGPESGCNGRAR